jgi:hypothetical protein
MLRWHHFSSLASSICAMSHKRAVEIVVEMLAKTGSRYRTVVRETLLRYKKIRSPTPWPIS